MRATPFLAAIAAALLLAAPASAAPAAIVPPGNSAAAQYTEAFPTASGERDTDREQKPRSPQKVLGAKNSKQLQQKGPEGKAVADLVAETSPAPDSAAVEAENSPSSNGTSGKKKQGGDSGQPAGGGGNASGGGPAGGSGGSGKAGQGGGTVVVAALGSDPAGSSGVGEAVGQATGASSGELGIFLPLILVGGLLWALLFAWRRRQGERVA